VQSAHLVEIRPECFECTVVGAGECVMSSCLDLCLYVSVNVISDAWSCGFPVWLG
jgi:hypothetical protein